MSQLRGNRAQYPDVIYIKFILMMYYKSITHMGIKKEKGFFLSGKGSEGGHFAVVF